MARVKPMQPRSLHGDAPCAPQRQPPVHMPIPLRPTILCRPQGILSQHRHKFSGVLNGIDHEAWCPETDAFVPAHFSALDPAGKERCKRLLLEELGMPYHPPAGGTSEVTQQQGGGGADGAEAAGAGAGTGAAPSAGRPLLAVVSRLTVQKGLPLIEHGIKTAIARGAQVPGCWRLLAAPAAADRRPQLQGPGSTIVPLSAPPGFAQADAMSACLSSPPPTRPTTPPAQVVVLGTASEPAVQRHWEEMAAAYARGGDARLVLRYDEGLAHRIYAGADMILVCGCGCGCGGGCGCAGRRLRQQITCPPRAPRPCRSPLSLSHAASRS